MQIAKTVQSVQVIVQVAVLTIHYALLTYMQGCLMRPAWSTDTATCAILVLDCCMLIHAVVFIAHPVLYLPQVHRLAYHIVARSPQIIIMI